MSFLEIMFGNLHSIIIFDVLYVLLCNFFVSLFLLKINCVNVRFWRCISFTLIMTAMVSVPVYILITALFLLGNLFSFGVIPMPVRVLLIALFSYRNPLWLAVYFFAARKILKLPKRSVANSALLMFLLIELSALVSDSTEYLYLPFQEYISAEAAFSVFHIILIILLIVISVYLIKYIDRNIHRLKMLFEAGTENKKHLGLRSFLLACSLWSILALGLLLLSSESPKAKAYFSLIMIVFIVDLIFITVIIKIKNTQIYKKQLQNDMLFDSMEDLRGIHHDMNNIMQVYGGFIETKSYDRLENFHNELFNEVSGLNEKLDFHTKLKDSPALYGLFMSIEESAKKSGVAFNVKNISLFQQIDIPDVDLCRLLSNLINNAIESAADTAFPAVKIEVNHSFNNTAIISISNTVNEKVDTARMFQPGYTSKQGHSGRGLNEVNKILSRYYGCTVTPVCDEYNFSMNVRLPCLVK